MRVILLESQWSQMPYGNASNAIWQCLDCHMAVPPLLMAVAPLLLAVFTVLVILTVAAMCQSECQTP